MKVVAYSNYSFTKLLIYPILSGFVLKTMHGTIASWPLQQNLGGE